MQNVPSLQRSCIDGDHLHTNASESPSGPGCLKRPSRRLSDLQCSQPCSHQCFRILDLRPVFHCGGDLVKESGFVGSEGFPNYYKPNSKCTWRITVSHWPQHSCSPTLNRPDSYTICPLSRSPRETWSCSPSAFLTWRPTHSVGTTIWTFTTEFPTRCKSWDDFVEPSAPVLSFQPQTPWCWRWWLMERRRVEDLWPISAESNHTLMVGRPYLFWTFDIWNCPTENASLTLNKKMFASCVHCS